MKYAYYPGCSLTGSAKEYDAATRAVMAGLGVELTEIPDWTCCGASAGEAVSRLLTYALPARNLALSEKNLPGRDILIPCSACYLNHLRVVRDTTEDKRLKGDIEEVMAAEGLSFQGTGKVRHLLDVLVTGLGAARIGERTIRPLTGITVAPYYGCQALRPYTVFDDPERPASMNGLLKALGAEIFEWEKGGSCCGASLMATKKEVALHSVTGILKAAQKADVVVTICPMCQMNLEAHQKQALQLNGHENMVSILYLPQLMGLAFGLSEEEVMLNKNMAVSDRLLTMLRTPRPPGVDPPQA